MTFALTLKRLRDAQKRNALNDTMRIDPDDLYELLAQFDKSDGIARAAQMHTAEGMQRHGVRERFEAAFRAHEASDGIEPDSSAHAIGPDGKYEWVFKQNMWEMYQAGSEPVPSSVMGA
jgi:hypothetical protein